MTEDRPISGNACDSIHLGRAGAMVLSQQDRDQFETDGYLIIDPEVPDAVLDGIVADVAGRFPRETIEGQSKPVGRVQDAWKKSANVKALATAPKILAILEELYGRKPLPFQTLNFPIGTQQRAHSDTVHFNSMPAGLMCGVWVALEDIDMDNGPLLFYPGTHKLPVVSVDEVDEAGYIRPSFHEQVHNAARQVWHMARQVKHLKVPMPHQGFANAYSYYENYIQDLIDKVKPEPHYGVMKKGQGLIWASNLLHGGAPQKDRNRSRNSQVTHVYFEGCKYYTPLLSRGKDIHYRDPVWIV